MDTSDQSQLIIKGKNGYLLVEEASSKLFFPFSRLHEGEDFHAAAYRCLNKVVCIDAEIKGIVNIQHRSVLEQNRMIVTYYAEQRSGRGTLTEVPKVKIKWFAPQKAKQLPNVGIVKLIKKVESGVSVGALSPTGVLECTEGEGVLLKGEGSLNMSRPILNRGVSLEDQMLAQAGYGENELKQIGEMFKKQCGSLAGRLSVDKFTALMSQFGYSSDKCPQCFKAFQSSPKESGLTFSDFQMGIVCMDPRTIHGDLCAQFRCQYIFKFYNQSGTERLNFKDFQEMLSDIVRLKKVPIKKGEWEKVAADNWSNFEVSPSETLSMDDFLKVVGQLKFRGTSVLFRLPRSPISRNQVKVQPPPLSPAFVKKLALGQPETIKEEPEDMDITQPSISISKSNEDKKAGPEEDGKGVTAMEEDSMTSSDLSDDDNDENDLTIATHFVKVRRSGAVSDVSTLWDLVGTEAVSGSLDTLDKPGFDRLPSINAFDKQSKSNEMLSGLRYFEHALKDNGRGQPKTAFSWGAVDMVSVAKCFMDLCARASDVFTNESRLLEVSSPCYVLGDIHGNFHDLVCFEKVLWRMGPILTPATFLFLGDYVDRGPHGFEVVAYLLAQKLLMPSKFLLIRGNHEIREVQETFSYKDECLAKFGDNLGEEVWEATNKAFDCMPIAAVVNKKVFCVHGGIPFPRSGTELISAINDVPANLPNPITQSELAWDIMWNDPIRNDEIDPAIEAHLAENQGFIDNFARGTAHMFSPEALDDFLKRNKLSQVIRAHECKAAGFQIQQRGRLLTVFSSSHYCGSTNEAACVLIDNKKIRTIRLDTT